MLNLGLVEDLRYWITEREAIRVLREGGAPAPWTQDKIFQSYRFCNIRREDDKVTRWLASHWRAPQFWSQKNFVPAMIFARTINWPETLERLGFPFIFDPEKWLFTLDQYQGTGAKVYTGAYFITAGPTGIRKNVWVLGNAETYFHRPPKLDPLSLENSWMSILGNSYPCVGPFIAGQVIADLKYTSHLREAKDWWTWAALGPGSNRGLNRLFERNIKQKISQAQGLEEMQEIAYHLEDFNLHLQDIQNCLCEFDKYERAKFGEGRPKQTFKGT